MPDDNNNEVRTTIYLKKDIYKQVKLYAVQHDSTVKEIINHALTLYISAKN